MRRSYIDVYDLSAEQMLDVALEWLHNVACQDRERYLDAMPNNVWPIPLMRGRLEQLVANQGVPPMPEVHLEGNPTLVELSKDCAYCPQRIAPLTMAIKNVYGYRHLHCQADALLDLYDRRNPPSEPSNRQGYQGER